MLSTHQHTSYHPALATQAPTPHLHIFIVMLPARETTSPELLLLQRYWATHDNRHLDRIVRMHWRLIEWWGRRYANNDLDREADLTQQAAMGFHEGLTSYRPARAAAMGNRKCVSVVSHATTWVRKRVLEYIEKEGLIHVPWRGKRAAQKIDRTLELADREYDMQVPLWKVLEHEPPQIRHGVTVAKSHLFDVESTYLHALDEYGSDSSTRSHWHSRQTSLYKGYIEKTSTDSYPSEIQQLLQHLSAPEREAVLDWAETGEGDVTHIISRMRQLAGVA